MYNTKSVMLDREQIRRIEELVEYSKEIMLYHSFSVIVRMAIAEGLEKVEERIRGYNRPEYIKKIMDKKEIVAYDL